VFFQKRGIDLWHDGEDVLKRPASDRFRLTLLLGGSGIFERTDGSRLLVEAPAVLLGDETDAARLVSAENWQARTLYFHPGVVNDRLDFITLRQGFNLLSFTDQQDRHLLKPFLMESGRGIEFTRPPLPVFQRLVFVMDELVRELETQADKCWPCRARMLAIELFSLCAPSAADDRALALKQGDTMVESLLMYLHAHYNERVSLESLVKVFATNRTSLNERFRAVTGTSAMDYLNRLRLDMAQAMLRDSTVPVGEIMLRAGFHDATHFGRLFKRETGLSPSDYRARMCWLLRPKVLPAPVPITVQAGMTTSG
jgi:AraC family L-rhamnose operon regulatory protein RhaS